MTRGIDRRAVIKGATVALAVMVAVLLLVEVVDALVGMGADSNLVFVFYLLVVGGLVAGGRVSAREGFDAPLTNGALAAVSAYGIVIVAVTAIRLASGRDVDPVAVTFNAMVAVSAGILGAVLAMGRRPRAEAEPARRDIADDPREPSVPGEDLAQ